jgi:chromosome condensin MukBEF MukE localization factor
MNSVLRHRKPNPILQETTEDTEYFCVTLILCYLLLSPVRIAHDKIQRHNQALPIRRDDNRLMDELSY